MTRQALSGGRCTPGLTPLDEELAKLLRATGKRVLVAANNQKAREYKQRLRSFTASALRSISGSRQSRESAWAKLLDALLEDLKQVPNANAVTTVAAVREIRLAIIAGQMLEVLIIESADRRRACDCLAVAGTTRDAMTRCWKHQTKSFASLIRRDSAQGQDRRDAEKLSVVMAMKSLERADVAIVLVDAEEGVTALMRTLPVTRTTQAVQYHCSQ